MKKALCIMITILVVTTSIPGLAAVIDFNGYNDAALIELLTSVQKEIAHRHIEKSANLPQGSYIVGKDIPAGSYNITVIYKGSMWMDIYIYAGGDGGNVKQDFTVFADGDFGDGVGNFHVELVEGDLLKCTVPITLTISAAVMFK